jgi:two-component system, cell cycle sensor histidine kinase and response regulator CckA
MRRRSTLAPLAVLLVGLTVSALAGREVQQNAERELAISLERGASEIGLLIQGLALGFEGELSSLAAVAAVTGGDPLLQQSFVEDQGLDGGYVLIDASEPTMRIAAVVAPDAESTATQRAMAEAFLASPGPREELRNMVVASSFGFVLGGEESPTLALAAGTIAGDGSAYAALRLFDVGDAGLFITPPIAGTDRFAVYAADVPDRSRAVLATEGPLPLGGSSASLPTAVGDQTLLIEVAGDPTHPIPPAVVIGTGIAATLLLAGLLSAALRRRDAALRALAAAERADQQFRAALLASPDVILRWDVERDELQILNRDVFYGHPVAGKVEGSELLALVVPEDRDRVHVLGEVARQGGEGSDVDDVRIRAADGTDHWVHMRFGRMQPERSDGDLLIVMTDTDDVHRAADQRMAVEAEMQQAQRMESVGQLAGGIAHDFNNLLAAIAATAELVLADVEDPTIVADVEAILDATQRGSGLTKQLLSFSRRGLSRREEVEVDTVVTGMTDLLRRTIGEHIDLEVSAGAPGAHVLGDPAELEQVLLNLVVNARDASTGSGLHLSVRTEVAHGHVVLRVQDDGAGMAPDVVDRAFEPFFSTKSPDQGTGLGLSIVYGIATRMGGSVSIRSPVGRGTEVRVELPCTAGSPTPADILAAVAAGAGRHESVLLVEDEPAVRRAAQRLLERAGHRVVAAADGHEALDAVMDGLVPTVLLTDVVLPGMLTGHDVAERVRALVPGVRVVYASGYSRDVLTAEQLVAEHASFISKPFTSRSLLDAVAGPVEVAS